jgi:hypothetical protein
VDTAPLRRFFSAAADRAGRASRNTFSFAHRSLQRMPLFGPLFRVKFTAQIPVAREAAVTVAMSTIPFWLGGYVLVLLSNSTKNWDLYTTSVSRTFERGELLVVGPSLLAPVILLVWKTWPERDRIQKGTLVILSVALMLLSTIPFALELAKVVPDQPYVVSISKVCLAAAVLILYVHLVGDSLQPADIGLAQEQGERNLRDRLVSRRVVESDASTIAGIYEQDPNNLTSRLEKRRQQNSLDKAREENAQHADELD